MSATAPPTRPPSPGTGPVAPRWQQPAATPAAPARARRKHPSHRARVVALASSVAATGGLSFAMSTASHASTGGVASGLTASSATSGSAGTTVAYADGTYTGTEVTNKYGPVEVQVTVTGGKVSAVALVEQPSDGKSQDINAQAAPVLEQEAVAAQSSTLDIVSGATYTSQSYVTSLQAALDRAASAATTSSATPIATGTK